MPFGSWEHWIYSALSFYGDEQDQKHEAGYMQNVIPYFTHHKQIQTKQDSPISFPVGQRTYGTCVFMGQVKPKNIAQNLLQRIKINKYYFLLGERKSMSVLTCEEIPQSKCFWTIRCFVCKMLGIVRWKLYLRAPSSFEKLCSSS